MPDIQTAKQYAEYQRNVAAFIAREGLSHLSTGCMPYGEPETEQEDNQDGEPWFSWHACKCCGCALGGMREYLFGQDVNNAVVQFTICEDCVYYVNYGRLDDATMQRVEPQAEDDMERARR
jgi:hypothetical protein